MNSEIISKDTSIQVLNKLLNTKIKEVEIIMKDHTHHRGILIGFFLNIFEDQKVSVENWHIAPVFTNLGIDENDELFGQILNHQLIQSIQFIHDLTIFFT